MQIKQACQACSLTKKALEYYEAKGLISPRVLDNGYRDYSEADILALKEIAVLRKCGLSVTDIGGILHSEDKAAALAKHQYVSDLRRQRLQLLQHRMERLIDHYDVEREFSCLQSHGEEALTIREKLILAFPGSYGVFLSLHFGRFLNGTIDSQEKNRAYHAVIAYLDQVPLHLPAQLAHDLETSLGASEMTDAHKIEELTNSAFLEALQDPDRYLQEHREDIAHYLAFRESDEYKRSPAAAMQKLMKEFQQQSGYFEHVVENLKILSPSYADYLAQLEAVDELLLQAFPQAKEALL